MIGLARLEDRNILIIKDRKIRIFSIGRTVAPATRGRIFERQQEAINQYIAATLTLAANAVMRSIIFKLIK